MVHCTSYISMTSRLSYKEIYMTLLNLNILLIFSQSFTLFSIRTHTYTLPLPALPIINLYFVSNKYSYVC